MVLSTTTTIVTFLMVFIIQHTKNKGMLAVQLKLDELIAAVDGASNRLINIQDLSERDMEDLYARYQRLALTSAKLTMGAQTTVEDDAEGRVSASTPT
jgi:low affinity Fe/Cu permease